MSRFLKPMTFDGRGDVRCEFCEAANDGPFSQTGEREGRGAWSAKCDCCKLVMHFDMRFPPSRSVAAGPNRVVITCDGFTNELSLADFLRWNTVDVEEEQALRSGDRVTFGGGAQPVTHVELIKQPVPRGTGRDNS